MQRRPHPWLKLSGRVALAAILALGSLAACSSTSVTSKLLPTATAGDIKILVSQTQFNVSDPVGVTVTNTSNQTFYAVNGRSGCTFLQLQELDTAKNSWVSVSGCPAASPTPLAITPQLSEPFTLAPNSPSNENAWDPGTYRVALLYSASSDGSSSPLLAFSAAFTVVSG
ncbi:MAG: hypothetical protein ACLQUY_23550 [Ktedonobacterales bacterium]